MMGSSCIVPIRGVIGSRRSQIALTAARVELGAAGFRSSSVTPTAVARAGSE